MKLAHLEYRFKVLARTCRKSIASLTPLFFSLPVYLSVLLKSRGCTASLVISYVAVLTTEEYSCFDNGYSESYSEHYLNSLTDSTTLLNTLMNLYAFIEIELNYNLTP